MPASSANNSDPDAFRIQHADSAITKYPFHTNTLPTHCTLLTSSLVFRKATILIFLLFILVLAIFLGFEIISKVPSLLHTPLMSGSNAISGVTVVGAIIAAGLAKGVGDNDTAALIGGIAIALAMINVVGGYFVTDRMLNMFRKKEKKNP